MYDQKSKKKDKSWDWYQKSSISFYDMKIRKKEAVSSISQLIY